MPLHQEEHITINPMVMGVLMFGREREQAGVFIEPQPEYAIDPKDERALAEFRNKIWYALVNDFLNNELTYAGHLWRRRIHLHRRSPKFSKK